MSLMWILWLYHTDVCAKQLSVWSSVKSVDATALSVLQKPVILIFWK